MKKSIVLITILVTYFFVLVSSPVLSYTSSCPSGMSDAECLAYLQQQANKLSQEKSSLSGKVSKEQYNQMSLLQKINYLDSQIIASENQIKKLELNIETKNVEIRILGADILELQNNIDTVSQEVTRLDSAITKRMALTYKYSYITPLEIFLESRNFDTLLRRFKYLAESRKKDKELLAELEVKRTQLESEEEVLVAKKADVEKKKKGIEEDKSDLYEEKAALSQQRGDKSTLLAISNQKEADYNKQIAALRKVEAQITAKISDIIFNLYKSGQLPANTPVKKGDVVGFQGHTGLAYGSHLHFELRKNGVLSSPYSLGYFTYPNGNGTGRFPMPNASVSYPHWDGSKAIDMHSLNNYLYSPGDRYYTRGVSCYGYHVPAGYYGLQGEGAPLVAIKDGKVSRVFTDACGGKGVIVDYGGGVTTMYLHLR